MACPITCMYFSFVHQTSSSKQLPFPGAPPFAASAHGWREVVCIHVRDERATMCWHLGSTLMTSLRGQLCLCACTTASHWVSVCVTRQEMILCYSLEHSTLNESSSSFDISCSWLLHLSFLTALYTRMFVQSPTLGIVPLAMFNLWVHSGKSLE